MSKIVFIVTPKVHLLDVNGPAHIFYEARELGLGVQLQFVSMDDGTNSVSSAGLVFSNLEAYESLQLQESDFIMIPGASASVLSPHHLQKHYQSFFDWLKHQHDKGVGVCGICTGIYILAAAGILNNRNCTTHWRYIDELSKLYPALQLQDNRLFVKDQNIYTSAGVSSGIDMALYIIEQMADVSLVAQIAKEVVYPLRRNEKDPQLNIYLQYRNHLDNRVLKIQDYMIQHLKESFTISDLAAQINMSTRNLTRLFKQKTGTTITEYISRLRLEKSLELLSEGHKIEAVANACGLKSTNQLRNLLKKYNGTLPSAIKSLS